MNQSLRFPPVGVDDLARILKPASDGGILDVRGQVEVISSVERDMRPVFRDLRWGVYGVAMHNTALADALVWALERGGLKARLTGMLTRGLMKRLPPHRLLAIGLNRAGGKQRGLTLARLRAHPEGIDLGPLKPSLGQALTARNKRINLLPAGIRRVPRAEIAPIVEGIVHKLRLPEVVAIPVGRWRDVFDAVPPVLKEAAYGVGCTTWEVFRFVVLPFTKVGVIGGFMLGLGRALGETMAVTFVIGNAHHVSASLLAPGTTISASIANEFTEAVGDLYTSSLVALGLILFCITFVVNLVAEVFLRRGRHA